MKNLRSKGKQLLFSSDSLFSHTRYMASDVFFSFSSLRISCTHCHVASRFFRDSRNPDEKAAIADVPDADFDAGIESAEIKKKRKPTFLANQLVSNQRLQPHGSSDAKRTSSRSHSPLRPQPHRRHLRYLLQSQSRSPRVWREMTSIICLTMTMRMRWSRPKMLLIHKTCPSLQNKTTRPTARRRPKSSPAPAFRR